MVQQNVGRRPIVWAITAGRDFGGLADYVVQQALGFALRTTPPDTTSAALDTRRLAGAPLDIPLTERLLWETYRYAGLLEGDVTKLESTSASIASTLSLPYTQLAYAYSARGEHDKMMRALERAMQLTPNPALRAALAELRVRGAARSSLVPSFNNRASPDKLEGYGLPRPPGPAGRRSRFGGPKPGSRGLAAPGAHRGGHQDPRAGSGPSGACGGPSRHRRESGSGSAPEAGGSCLSFRLSGI